MKRFFLLTIALALALSAVYAAAGEEGDFGVRSDGRIQDYYGLGGAVTVPAEVLSTHVISVAAMDISSSTVNDKDATVVKALVR